MTNEKYDIKKARKVGGNLMVTVSKELEPKEGDFIIVKKLNEKEEIAQ